MRLGCEDHSLHRPEPRRISGNADRASTSGRCGDWNGERVHTRESYKLIAVELCCARLCRQDCHRLVVCRQESGERLAQSSSADKYQCGVLQDHGCSSLLNFSTSSLGAVGNNAPAGGTDMTRFACAWALPTSISVS